MTRGKPAEGGFFGEDRHVLGDVVRAALRRAGGTDPEGAGQVPGWEFTPGTPWTYVAPTGVRPQAQGWKLHVSATPLSAPLVLGRVAGVLGRRRCPFKYATTFDDVGRLVSREQDRGAVGKFITVYPPGDQAAVEIAQELFEVTYGLPGPPVLSDRLYRPGGLVYYRFGVFSAPSELDNDGSYASRLRAPDGSRETDRREAWYAPPAWVTCPFESGREPVRTAPPQAVLLADRFEVRQALRHGAKGGVFLADDRATGGKAVIKQARPHLGATILGQDERDRLRHEARMLDLFGPLGVTARKLALFECDGNLFLAQERVEGTVLAEWPGARLDRPDRADAALSLLRRLVTLLETVHGQGHVLRDLTPNNVMVTGEGECRLIDLEMAAVPGTPVARAYTPGYAPPEQVGAPPYAPAPGVTADLYALGATALYLLTSALPPHCDDQPADARPWDERVERVVGVAAAGDPLCAALSPLILGLMQEDPGRRWDLARVRAFLDGAGPGRVVVHPPRETGTVNASELDRLIEDGLAYTLRTMTPGIGDTPSARLWPATGFGLTADPCAVQYGAAGVVALWAALLDPARPDGVLPPDLRRHLTTGLERAADWTVRAMAAERRPSPGLYFGRAGVAVALYEAGRVLDDDRLCAAGLDLGLELPTRWPNPDVCHGAAGTGLALLHLWRASGDPRLRERAHACADGLLKAATCVNGPANSPVTWPIPADFDSALAGAEHYGFAHGVAGIATCLLAAADALEREDCLEMAVAAGETLVAAAEYTGEAAWWPEGPHGGRKLPHWCNGSSGVGTYLVRLHRVTGDARVREAAEAAAVAVHESRLNSGTAACHGLAGDGQFLLDLAESLDAPVHRARAEDLAASLWARAVLRDGLLVVPDETAGADVTVAWNTGLAGVLDFLYRLRHGGPRRWMAGMDDAARTARTPAGAAR